MRYYERDGLKVSQIGVGCYGLSGAYGAKDRAEFARVTSATTCAWPPRWAWQDREQSAIFRRRRFARLAILASGAWELTTSTCTRSITMIRALRLPRS